jgi:hypothetical protein
LKITSYLLISLHFTSHPISSFILSSIAEPSFPTSSDSTDIFGAQQAKNEPDDDRTSDAEHTELNIASITKFLNSHGDRYLTVVNHLTRQHIPSIIYLELFGSFAMGERNGRKYFFVFNRNQIVLPDTNSQPMLSLFNLNIVHFFHIHGRYMFAMILSDSR